MARNGIWSLAGAMQDARKDCVAVVLADMISFAVKSALGLPAGMVWGDPKEAFDTAWRPPMLLRMRDELCARLWCVAYFLLMHTRVSVVTSSLRSVPVRTRGGVIEGRKLSPL
jgi:hypothetical protein